MVTVKDNHFYRKQVVTQAVALKSQFKDLPVGTEDMLTIQGGIDATCYALSGTVPTAPKFGQYELDGGELQIYVSGVTMNKQPIIPKLNLYKFNTDINIKEGGVTLAKSGSTTVGHKLNVYVGTIDADNVLVEESFDGTDKSLGEVQLFQNQTNSTVTLSDAYMSVSDAADKIWTGGNKYPGYGSVENNLKKYFSDDDKVRIVPVQKNRPKGTWTTRIDNRPDKWSIYVPYWKFKDIVGVLQFEKTNPSTNNPDTEPEPSENTTILSNFFSTPNVNNPYSADTNNSLVMSSISLSTEKSKTGPQSLRFYHLFDFNKRLVETNKRFGDIGWAPQVARASLTPIPFPWPNNFGKGATRRGDNRATVPMVTMSMNINKMAPAVYIDAADTSAAGLNTAHSYYKQATVPEGTTGMGTLQTFGRSVAITFSNYEPKKEHTTLDRFLAYGMDRFYSGTTTENIVGGIAFIKAANGADFTQGINNDYAFAFPIAVTKYGSSPGVSLNAIQNSGSMFKFTGTDTSNDNPDSTMNAFIMAYESLAPQIDVTDVKSTSPINMVAVKEGNFFNMDFCFDPTQNVNVQTNSKNPYNMTSSVTGDFVKSRLGSPLRVYFTELATDEGDTNNDPLADVPYIDVPFPCSGANAAATSLSNNYNFMGNGGIAGVASGSLWPYCMTVWVNNHRYYTSYDPITQDTFFAIDTTEKKYFSDGTGASQTVNAPTDYQGWSASGSATETELFIDSISLKNFNYTIENASATKGTFSRPISFNKNELINTPIANTTSGSTGFATTFSSTGTVGTGSSTGTWTQTVVGSPISYGFNEKDYLPLNNNGADTTDGKGGFILMNGFTTKNFSSLERFNPSYFPYGAPTTGTAIISTAGTAGQNDALMGSQALANSYVDAGAADNAIVTQAFPITQETGAAFAAVGLTSGFFLASGSNAFLSTDGLTQKGFIKTVVSGSDYTNWNKRENIFCSAKILSIPDFDRQTDLASTAQVISVDNPEIFSTDDDDEYMIFKVGEALADTSQRLGYSTRTLKLAQDNPVAGSNISLVLDNGANIKTADDGSTDLLTKDNLPYLYISPKKYWLTMLNAKSGFTTKTYDAACIVNEDLSNADASLSTYTGTTYNESIYSYDTTLETTLGNSGLYLKPWNIDLDPEESALNLTTDFGFGVYDEEKATGGQLATAIATKQNFTTFDISKILTEGDDKVTYGSDFVLKLAMANDTDDRSVTITGDDNTNTDYVPTFTWEYKDELPSVRGFTVNPATNVVSDDKNLYELTKENLNAVRFNWSEESDDDVWYRHLFISKDNIPNKYKNASLHIPMNESGSVTATPVYKFYDYTATGGVTSGNVAITGSDLRASIEGLQGYAVQYVSGSYLAIPNASGAAMHGLNKYFMTLHAIPPSSLPSAMNLVAKGVSTSGFELLINSDAKVVVKQRGSNITGTTILPIDGETPVNIAVSYHSGSSSGRDLKLYVNGSLEGYQSSVSPVNNTDELKLGINRNGTSSAFTGKLEEFVLYDLTAGEEDIVVVDASDEYIYNTADLNDLDSNAKVITHQARMYIMDYHNIRGESDQQVCSSNQTSWRTSAI